MAMAIIVTSPRTPTVAETSAVLVGSTLVDLAANIPDLTLVSAELSPTQDLEEHLMLEDSQETPETSAVQELVVVDLLVLKEVLETSATLLLTFPTLAPKQLKQRQKQPQPPVKPPTSLHLLPQANNLLYIFRFNTTCIIHCQLPSNEHKEFKALSMLATNLAVLESASLKQVTVKVKLKFLGYQSTETVIGDLSGLIL